MKLFVDTSGWGNVIDANQPFHARAVALMRIASAATSLITTNFVLLELCALMNSPLRISKPRQIQLIRDLRSDPAIEVIDIDANLQSQSWQLWESRPDKDWTLTDCASFVVMTHRGLTEALTTDRHFEQAGFARLLV